MADAVVGLAGSLRERVESLEARILKETMARCRWNKSRAADELGLSRVGLRAKLERYGLEPPVRPVESEGGDGDGLAARAAEQKTGREDRPCASGFRDGSSPSRTRRR